jgi:CDP-diglyceride synthetase
MLDRERRDYIAITVGLLVFLFVMYLRAEGGWILAITMIVAAGVSYGAYWIGRRYKKRSGSGRPPGARQKG